MDLVLRRADPAEAPLLSALAWRAKAHWGYAPDVLALWARDLDISADDLSVMPAFVAEIADTLCGCILLDPAEPRWKLDALWIDPPRIGQGLGTALLRYGLDYARALGAQGLTIDADPNAADFYRRSGALETGVQAAPLPGDPARVRPQLVLDFWRRTRREPDRPAMQEEDER